MIVNDVIQMAQKNRALSLREDCNDSVICHYGTEIARFTAQKMNYPITLWFPDHKSVEVWSAEELYLHVLAATTD